MTFEGTLQKIGILFGLMTISALGTVVLGFIVPGLLYPMMIFGMFGTIGMGLYLVFSRPSNPQTPVMIYAFMEGFFIGPLTLFFELSYPGIVCKRGECFYQRTFTPHYAIRI